MKRFFKILSIMLLCGALSAPVINAQRHGGAGNGGSRERTTRTTGNSRNNHSSNSSRSTGSRTNNRNNGNNHNNGVNRNNGGNHNNGGRHGLNNGANNGNKNHGILNNGHNNGNRPGVGNGNNHNNGNRPGVGNGNHNNGNRPGVGNGNHNNGFRPDNNHGYRPGASNHPIGSRPTHLAPPPRPHRPNMYRPHHRPTPPPRWRPSRGVPAIRGILGLTFGVGLNLSLDYLYNSGYTVDGYTNDVVYLRNVNQLNYIWTDAALYYGNNGLDVSSFYYATPYYDMTRYNAVYNNLVALYGTPVAINSGGQIGATWFGGNQGYITLSFGANNVSGGALRYLTTLTFGL